VFYRRIKNKYEFGTYELNNEGASRTSTYILFCDKTRVLFRYSTARPSLPQNALH